ncbi:hypothetical protein [Pseudanabaena sp. Chao 1811]|uniref:hypothetical protein n=1 Tax=Pseudanabaena sp. Chao 1811 TaxID=2963092 RepID=UPI0022F3A230|nr:hypothetical protein [Pseudanabaena sp. Chao 1811]
MSVQQSSKLAVISSVSIALSIAATSLIASPSEAYSRSRLQSQSQISQTQTPSQPTYPNQVAQLFRSTLSLPAGQAIATKINRQDTLYIAKGETVNATLLVAQDIKAPSNGTVLIPAGAVIEGQFVPVEGGSKFVAQKFTSRGATISLQAESALINDMKDPRETNAGSILTDAGIGGAAGAVLSGVLRGNVQILDVLGGAAAGAVIGNVTAPQVTVIEPNTVINILTKQTITFAVRDDY